MISVFLNRQITQSSNPSYSISTSATQELFLNKATPSLGDLLSIFLDLPISVKLSGDFERNTEVGFINTKSQNSLKILKHYCWKIYFLYHSYMLIIPVTFFQLPGIVLFAKKLHRVFLVSQHNNN